MEQLEVRLLADDRAHTQGEFAITNGSSGHSRERACSQATGNCNHNQWQCHGHIKSFEARPDSQSQTTGHGKHLGQGVETPTSDRLMFDTLANSVHWLNAHDVAECPKGPQHVLANYEQSCCDNGILNSTSNMLVLVRANELIAMSRVNTCLALLAVLYFATNLVCAILNSYDNDCDPKAKGCSPATTPLIFHNLEFWATFFFNMVDLLALSYSPRTLSSRYQHPVFLKLMVLANVGISFLSCLLVAINLDKFEILSHELEYTNELTLTIFDACIVLNLTQRRSREPSQAGSDALVAVASLVLALFVAATQLGIYNLSGWTADGDSKGEKAAHYLEFAFGAVSAIVTFWFTMDNRLRAEKRLRQIMYVSTEPSV